MLKFRNLKKFMKTKEWHDIFIFLIIMHHALYEIFNYSL